MRWSSVVIFCATLSPALLAGDSKGPKNKSEVPEGANESVFEEIINRMPSISTEPFEERKSAPRNTSRRRFKDYRNKSTISNFRKHSIRKILESDSSYSGTYNGFGKSPRKVETSTKLTRAVSRNNNISEIKSPTINNLQSRAAESQKNNYSSQNTFTKPKARKGIKVAKNIFRGNQPASWTLVYTALVVRHGTRDARKVVSLFAGDRSWSRGSDALTEAGIAGIRRLGKRLKNQYASLIGNPKLSDIRAFSTIFGRTRQTARILLEELYGPDHEDTEIINFNTRWNGGTMVKYSEALDAYDDTEFRDYEKKLFDKLYPKVEPYIPDFSIDKVSRFIDTMLCEEANGVVHPEEIKEEMVNFHRYNYWKFTRDHHNTLLKQVIAAPYISEILSSIKRVEGGISGGIPKFEIFSSHDNYIQTIMRALDAISPFHRYFKTDFGCGIIFELYRYEETKPRANNKARSYGYIVKIFYNYDTSLRLVEAVPIRGCRNSLFNGQKQEQPFCHLHEFEYAMRDYSMDKYEYAALCSGQKCENQNDYKRILAEVRDRIRMGITRARVVPNSFTADRPIRRR